jgi:hypothetical protein
MLAGVVSLKYIAELTKDKSRFPFDFAQGRLSTPLKYAPLRMTGFWGGEKKNNRGSFGFAQDDRSVFDMNFILRAPVQSRPTM